MSQTGAARTCCAAPSAVSSLEDLFAYGAPGERPRACGTVRWASPVIDTGLPLPVFAP